MGNILKSIGNGTGLGLRGAGLSSTSATIYVTDPGRVTSLLGRNHASVKQEAGLDAL